MRLSSLTNSFKTYHFIVIVTGINIPLKLPLCLTVLLGECERYKYMDLHCKVAVITGGATGIGFATAAELLNNQLYRVAIIDCHCEDGNNAVQKLTERFGQNKACFVNIDVRRRKDLEAAMREISDTFGGIDILVNNAGYLSDANWKDEVDINVKSIIGGSLLGMKYLPRKRKSGDSVIVNVSSTLGLDSNPPHLPIFSATQHAISGLTRSLGDLVHYKSTGVRVVGICPGPTNTGLLTCQPHKALHPDLSAEANLKLLAAMQKPEEVAKAIAYMTQYAHPASLFVIENGTLYTTEIPNSKKYRKRIVYV